MEQEQVPLSDSRGKIKKKDGRNEREGKERDAEKCDTPKKLFIKCHVCYASLRRVPRSLFYKAQRFSFYFLMHRRRDLMSVRATGIT